MNTKIALVAALAIVAASQTDAKFSIKKVGKKVGHGAQKLGRVAVKANELGLLEEDEWSVEAGISGQGGAPSWNVGISHSWEEEQSLKNEIKKAANLLVKANELGLLEEEAVEAQGLGKSLKKAAKIVVTASELGLLEEDDVLADSEQKFKLGKALKKAGHVLVKANELGLLEEEQGWDFNAGISGQGGKPSWNVGIKGSWEEEEEQKFKLGKALKKVANVAVKANQLGLLEEEEEEQKFKLGKTLKKITNVAVKANQLGLLEEEEEQKIKLGKALKKITNVAVKANQLGLLEEEEWSVNAGISGQGGKPSWNVGVSHSWEEEEQKIKLGKALKKVGNVLVKARELDLL